MNQSLQKKYGLLTAISMVVGVVIGSGVFFKADDVLKMTNGNILLALLAWGLGAFSMIFGALVFAEFAQRIEKSNGIVDYSEAAYGKKFGYLVGWFKGNLYFTPLSAILAWVSSLYNMILLGSDNPTNSLATWVLAAVYLVGMYVLNYLAPLLAGKFQVASTVIKLIPLTAVALVGSVSGIMSGVTMDNFTSALDGVTSAGSTLATAVVATAFAYEGWIVALTINSEIKDSKKNLPKALTIGTLIVFAVYVLYFLGVSGVLNTSTIVTEGDNAISMVTGQLFGGPASTLLIVFVVISCLGTLNGLALSSIRIPYSLAIRGHGPLPQHLSKVNQKTNMPLNSALYAGLLSALYLMIWFLSINETLGTFIALDEIPIVMVYGLYVLLYLWYMKNFKDLNPIKRFVKPLLAMSGALVILYGGITNPSIGMYLIVSLLVVLLGLVFYRKESQITSQVNSVDQVS